ncbi:MAG: acyl-CoA dehydrogenase family protein [Acidobacteriota bacterium]|nr:acyl-CoA dehydrogenase family protein [Acidobacteriota bacterium]
MDFADSPREAEFRRELRAWIDAQRPFPPVPADDDERVEYLSDWQRRLYDAGWVAVSFPEHDGGRGLPAVYEAIVLDELGAAGAPPVWHYGYVTRVIQMYGSVQQRRRFLAPAFRGEERWCQGFSEPGAGSDLSAISTRARLEGDHYVVSGQKVWTSEAHWAKWCLLLARSEADRRRHDSLSCFIVPVDSPGLTVRPFRQITGSLEFAELFFDEVRIPVSMRIGDAGSGWRIAMSTVAFERGPADVGFIADFRRVLTHLEREVGEGRLRATPELLSRLVWAGIEVEALRLHVLSTLSRRARGVGAEDEMSIDKVLMTRADQTLAHVAIDLTGAGALTGQHPAILHQYMWSRAASVYGGSTQIQRDIIATRLLGLPRSNPRPPEAVQVAD